MPVLKYRTANNIEVTRSVSKIPFKRGLRDVMHSLDQQRGIYLSSGYEYPGTVLALGYRLGLPAAGDHRLRPPRRVPSAE